MRSSIKHTNTFFFLLLVLTLSITSCTIDDDIVAPTTYEIPTKYNFDNVNYDGQSQRLEMFTELKNYIKTSRTGAKLDATILQAMYANQTNAPWSKTYDSSKQLRGKTLENVQEDFDALLLELALTSQSEVVGSDGQSGLVTSLDGSATYLLGDDGLDHAQVFEKGLMGACLYYQATSVYFGSDQMDVDNEIIEAGEGTAMEHHWDEAFGYFGVPTDFPTNTDGAVYWGSYSIQRDPVLDCNQKMMDALLKGRAAISAKDLSTRDVAISETRNNWELIAVGSALHYLNSGIANFDDMALRAHSLSESIGFIYAIQFNSEQKITNAQVGELLELVAGSTNFASMNLYQASLSKLQQAKDLLAGYYNLSNRKDEF